LARRSVVANTEVTTMARRALSFVLFALAPLFFAGKAAADPSELPPAFAYDYGETQTPRSAGVAAMHALGAGVTALYVNPANLGLTRSYHIAALGQFTPEAKRHLYGAAVMDSTRRVSGGGSFIGGFQDKDGIDRSTIDARVAMAFAVTKGFHIGLGGRYLRADQDGLGPLGESRASGGLLDASEPPHGRQTMINTVTLDAGMTYKPIDQLALAAFGQNITYPNNGLLPTLVGLGIGYGTKDWSVEVDGLADINSYSKPSPRLMAGGEYLLLNHVPLRAGYRFDLLNGSGEKMSHQLSAGAGYVEPRFGIEASVRRTLVGPSATMVYLSFTYYVESLGLQIQQY
jgi:opacity protein-like surface antigen